MTVSIASQIKRYQCWYRRKHNFDMCCGTLKELTYNFSYKWHINLHICRNYGYKLTSTRGQVVKMLNALEKSTTVTEGKNYRTTEPLRCTAICIYAYFTGYCGKCLNVFVWTQRQLKPQPAVYSSSSTSSSNSSKSNTVDQRSILFQHHSRISSTIILRKSKTELRNPWEFPMPPRDPPLAALGLRNPGMH